MRKSIKKSLLTVFVAIFCAMLVLFGGTTLVKANDEIDITQNLELKHWISQSELKVTYLVVGDGVIPSGANYDLTSGAYTYVQDYIYINGRAISEINSDTSLGFGTWEYTVFPSDRMDQYKVPVVLFGKTKEGEDESYVDAIQIKIHANYLATLGNKVEITVKSGLSFENGEKTYVVTQDKTFTAWEMVKMEEVDVTDNVSVKYWVSQGEFKATYLELGAGLIPTGTDYAVTFGAYAYVQDYILINGRTIKEINSDQTLGFADWATV